MAAITGGLTKAQLGTYQALLDASGADKLTSHEVETRGELRNGTSRATLKALKEAGHAQSVKTVGRDGSSPTDAFWLTPSGRAALTALMQAEASR